MKYPRPAAILKKTGKGADALFRIGEFSKLTKVSVRMLRYYDETGLLKPALTDPATGYRLYSTGQIAPLQRILLLRDMEFTVAEMAAVLRGWDEQAVAGRLRAKRRELLQGIEQQRRRVEKLDAALSDLAGGRLNVHYNVLLKTTPALSILSLRQVIPDHFCEGALWERLHAFVRQKQVPLAPGVNNLAFFYDEGQREQGVDVEVAVQVKRPGKSEGGFVYRTAEPVEDMACVMVYGPYENIGPSYHAFAYWLEEHRQYEMAGPSRQICHIGPYNETDAANFLTEVQTPVRLRA